MKTVLITGGAGEIGENIVKAFAKKEYTVLLNYNKSEQKAKQIQKEITELGFSIEIYKADITKKQEVDNMIEEIINKHKKIDILINNAGISQFKLFTEITEEEWDNMINTNLKSIYLVTQPVAKSMIKNHNGAIINMSSIWGMVGASCETHYSAAKAGIIGLTKALAKELGPSNIRVNAVAPGFIQTKMNKSLEEEIVKQIQEETPLNKLGTPQDVTKIIEWLIEDEFTTGQVISPNGGWVI